MLKSKIVEICKNCGKKMTNEEIRNQEMNLDGCKHYCSKACCDSHWDGIVPYPTPYPDCPCY